MLRDSHSTTGLDDWSMGLIQSVSTVRRTEDVSDPPHIPQIPDAAPAMIRLGSFPTAGLMLDRCGLLFLATPHLGTPQAEWRDLWVDIAKVAGVKRVQAFRQLLATFNEASVNAAEQFQALKPVPPVESLYETQRTPVIGGLRTIVPAASARLTNRAQPMLNADHRTICRFPNMHDPRFSLVLDCLDRIRNELATPRPRQNERDETETTGSPHRPAQIRGGGAVGGNAAAEGLGGRATGGSATGGDVAILSDVFRDALRIDGGTGEGGDAVGATATGGDGVGGDVVFGIAEDWPFQRKARTRTQQRGPD
ncbi:hypothetical protein VTK73DRAFT_4723 [Phialemonium thermophilum]|uniref:Uncharacterized protein n=1 Tax=Phialemonium thermophilum TaxID=223376 RepID=A0ABR3V701_9PEZI